MRLRRAAPPLLAAAALLLTIAAYAGSWSLVGSSFSGNGPGGRVVPGGEASLSVSLAYTGGSTASNVSVCLTGLPSGFALAPGESVCVGAGSVEPGGAVSATWRLLVSRSVAPGSYSFTVEVRYSENGTAGSESFTVTGVVSEPPRPAFRVVEAYWASGGYPGSVGSLELVLENDGPGDVAGGVMSVELPEGFTPRTLRVTVPSVPEGGTTLVTLDGVSIADDVAPGSYTAGYDANVSVEAGARYMLRYTGSFSFKVTEPPGGVVELVDYGLSPGGAGSPPGAGHSLYLVLRVAKPGATVRHVYAWAHLDGAVSANGSSTVFSTVTGAYNYGDPIVVNAGPIVLEKQSVKARVKLLIHVDEDGSSYWVTGEYELSVNAAQPGPLVLASIRWRGGHAYPGSSTVVEAVLVNRGPASLVVHNAVLETPWGSVPTGPVEAPPGAAVELSFPVNVPRDARPAYHVFTLRVNATAYRGGAAGEASYVFHAVLELREPPGKPGLELVSASWAWGGASCPLTRGARVEAVLRVSEPGLRVRSVRAWLEPGPGALVEGPGSAASVETGYGGFITLAFTGVGGAVKPGEAVPLVLHVEALLEDEAGAEYWVEESYPLALPVYREPPLRLVDAWLEPPTGSSGYASLALLVQWLYPYAEASSVDAALEAVEGGVALPGSGHASSATALGYGASTVLRLGPLRVDSSTVNAVVEVSGYAALPGGGWCGYTVEEKVNASRMRQLLLLLGFETLRGGEPAPLLPGAWGVEARIRLLNPNPWTVNIEVNGSSVRLPAGVELLSASGCSAAPGASCTVTLVLAVSRAAEPGGYNASIGLVVSSGEGGGVAVDEFSVSIPLAVARPVDYAARLVVAAWHWGTQGAPMPWAYAGTAPAELTVVVLNLGPWTAHGVVVSADTPLALVPRSGCASALEPGGFCAASLALDLRGVEPGSLEVPLRLVQVLSGHGSSVAVEQAASVTARVEPQPLGGGLGVVHVDWENGWIALPGDHARLVVLAANHWQLSVRGVNAVLRLPWGGVARGHLDGPLAPGASASITIPVDIPVDAKPGVYNATLILVYEVGGGDSWFQAVDKYNVSIEVWSPRRVFSVASAEWVEAGQSGSPGLVLRLVLRNDHAAAARGPVLVAVLPEGYYHTATGSRRLVAPPEGLATQLAAGQGAGRSPYGAEALARLLAEQASLGAAAVPQGGLVEYTLRLGAEDATRPLAFNATVVFVDHWGSLVKASVRVEAPAPGAPRLEPAAIQPRIVRLVNGSAAVRLVVRNAGESTALDVEAVLVPQVPLLLPVQSRLRLPPVPPGGEASATVMLVYNPSGSSVFGGEAPSYSSVPFTVALVYRDRLGHLYVYNATLSVVLEPIIYMVLLEARAHAANGTITVGGVVANRGTAAARSVTVEASAGGQRASTFIGDVEAAGQAAFRLDLPDTGAATVRLRIRYLDNYGVEHSVSYSIPVERPPQASYAAPGGGPGGGEEKGWQPPLAPVAAGVAGFLAAAAFMINRFLRRAEARLGGG